MENQIKTFGLRELPKDTRDFKLSSITKLPSLSELPEEFELPVLTIKNQKDTDFCAACASCGASEMQEEVELNPGWSFAISKKLSGDPESYGQDLRTIMKAHQRCGAIEENEAPYHFSDTEDSVMRYLNNWPKELCKKAKKHLKKSFFSITGQYDAFDNIRAFIWAFKAEKRAVVMGVLWSWPLSQAIMRENPESGGGHAIYAIGWKMIDREPYLVIQNSYGKDAGDDGKHYFSRKIINECVGKYGAFSFIDMPKKEAQKKAWSPCRQLLEAIKKLFK